MWVYWSSRRASENEDAKSLHQTATEIAARMEKTRLGDRPKIDSRFGVLNASSLRSLPSNSVSCSASIYWPIPGTEEVGLRQDWPVSDREFEPSRNPSSC